MPAVNSQAVIYDQAALGAGTKVGTTFAISLAPEPLTGDSTQQGWLSLSWSGLTAGSIQINVYNLPDVTVPAVKSYSPLLVATLVDSTNTPTAQTATSGCQWVFTEVMGPLLYAEAVVVGAGTPDCTVTLLATGQVTAI